MYQAFGTKKMGRNLTATPHLKATKSLTAEQKTLFIFRPVEVCPMIGVPVPVLIETQQHFCC